MSRCKEFYKIGDDELSCDSEEEHNQSQFLAERLHYDALHKKFWLDDVSASPVHASGGVGSLSLSVT